MKTTDGVLYTFFQFRCAKNIYDYIIHQWVQKSISMMSYFIIQFSIQMLSFLKKFLIKSISEKALIKKGFV